VAVALLEEDLATATTPEETFDCLRVSSVLQTTKETLPPSLVERVETINQLLQAKLRKDRPELYLIRENPVEARRAAGRRLRFAGAWADWCWQIRDIRSAATAGFKQINLQKFYRQSIDDLEKLAFRKSYVAHLCDVVECLAGSMSFNHRIAYQEMPYKDEAGRLAAYAASLFDWMSKSDESFAGTGVAELLPSVYKHLGVGYNDDRKFGVAVYSLLDGQLADGSWKTNPRAGDEPDSQGEYLELVYRATWAAVDALRPLRTDALNPANAALGLS
jgi:hypothetical protein